MLPVSICSKHLNVIDGDRWREHLFHLFFQSWNCWGCSSVRFILFSLLPLICKMKFMRRGEGLNKESRGCGYQTLKVSAVRHWVFPSSSGHRGGLDYGFPGSWSVLQGSNGISKLREREESCQLLKSNYALFLPMIHYCPVHLGRMQWSFEF